MAKIEPSKVVRLSSGMDSKNPGERVVARVPAPSGGVSLTKQSFKDECDINEILKRADAAGAWDSVTSGRVPVFADVSDVPDYRTCLDIVRSADEAFAALPARVRERFKNDPGALLDFIGDPANVEEARSLGLMKPIEAAAPAAAAASGGSGAAVPAALVPPNPA